MGKTKFSFQSKLYENNTKCTKDWYVIVNEIVVNKITATVSTLLPSNRIWFLYGTKQNSSSVFVYF